MVVAALSFTVRIGEFIVGVSSAPGMAMAQHEVDAEPPAMPHGDKKEDGGEEHAADAHAGQDITHEEPAMKEAEPTEWRDAVEEELEYSEVQMELFKDLRKRREDIRRKEKALETREALLRAAEQELERKTHELQILRDEIRELLNEQSEAEQARIRSLVKIYEGMKAKDAARIFDTLDMDVLLAVMSKMSERKTAPILASMNPDRARAVTILLAQQKQLPSLPDE